MAEIVLEVGRLASSRVGRLWEISRHEGVSQRRLPESVEPITDLVARRRGHSLRGRRRIQEVPHGGGQELGTPWRYQEPGFAGYDHIAHRVDRGRDHRNPACHGFDDRRG